MKLSYLLIFFSTFLFFNCQEDGANAPNDSSGKGGSMARFSVVGDHLYTVNNATLKLFDISNSKIPNYVNELNVGWGIETIYPYKNNLFLGSQTGMYIYNIDDPANPEFVSNYQHIFSCDPVVVNDKYAYITLRNGSACGRGGSRMEVVDISNLENPQLVKTYNMTEPYGLGIDGNTLFVCDDGLKVYNSTDPVNLVQLKHLRIEAYDVIPNNGVLMIIGSDGLYQYKYENNDIKFLSKLTLPRS
jgi:hypothetical protein